MSPVSFPHLAQVGDFGPPRSELGIGSLMPWNGMLYVQNYNSHKAASGAGVSLRRIDADLSMEIVAETLGVDGTYTNRFVHFPTSKLVLGPHVIDADHKIVTIPELQPLRVCGTSRHLTKPDTHVYVLAMEGELFELDLTTYECTQLFDLNEELGTDGEMQVHYKDCYTSFGRLVVCSNEYAEPEWAGERSRGRLAEYDGQTWKVLRNDPFTAIGGRHEFGGTIFATGWDRASAILEVFTESDQKWTRYRLPKASHCFDHKWQTEWPRIREVEHERLLLDHHGMFYELSPWAYGGRIWGVRPISTHLWVLGDFCSWRGMLVAGADNASPSHGLNPTTAEPQSGLWFGKTDDLWNFGKPAGWGGPWWETPVLRRRAVGSVSDDRFRREVPAPGELRLRAAADGDGGDRLPRARAFRCGRVADGRAGADPDPRVPARVQRALGAGGQRHRRCGECPVPLYVMIAG